MYAAVFSPDGLTVATGTMNGEVRLWDAATGQPITPPLRGAPGFGISSVAFSPDGRRLLAAGADGAARLWTLMADERAPEELARLAQLLTGARLDATGSLTPLEPAALAREWQSLRARYPGDFQAAPEELLAWRRQETEESEKAESWEAAVRDLTALIEAEPWNDELRRRRASAAAAAGQLDWIAPEEIRTWRQWEAGTEEQSQAWGAALPHLTALIDAEPENGELRLRRARVYFLTNRHEEAGADFLKAAALLPPSVAVGDLRPWVLKATQHPPGQPGLLGEYFVTEAPVASEAPPESTQRLLVRVDATLDFDWGEGSPDPAVPADDFQVRWTGLLQAPESGLYNLQVESDDGARLWVDGERLIDAWVPRPATKSEALVYLEAGWHRLQVDYFEAKAFALIHLRWNYPFGEGMRGVPAEAFGH